MIFRRKQKLNKEQIVEARCARSTKEQITYAYDTKCCGIRLLSNSIETINYAMNVIEIYSGKIATEYFKYFEFLNLTIIFKMTDEKNFEAPDSNVFIIEVQESKELNSFDKEVIDRKICEIIVKTIQKKCFKNLDCTLIGYGASKEKNRLIKDLSNLSIKGEKINLECYNAIYLMYSNKLKDEENVLPYAAYMKYNKIYSELVSSDRIKKTFNDDCPFLFLIVEEVLENAKNAERNCNNHLQKIFGDYTLDKVTLNPMYKMFLKENCSYDSDSHDDLTSKAVV